MYLLLITLLGITTVNSYVLLQVRKDDQNRSNVDALIHKVVPSDQFDIIAKKIAEQNVKEQKIARKSSFAEQTNEKIEKLYREDTESIEDDKLNDAVKDFMDTKPEFRTKNFNIKPRLVQLRSDQPSLMYEVNSNVIIKALKDFLSSKLVAQYTDDVAKRAAVVFRSMQEEDNK